MPAVALNIDRHPHAYQYRRCAGCEVALVMPTPPGWFFDLVKEGEVYGPTTAFVTPHSGGCVVVLVQPVPGIAVRLPGPAVSVINVRAA